MQIESNHDIKKKLTVILCNVKKIVLTICIFDFIQWFLELCGCKAFEDLQEVREEFILVLQSALQEVQAEGYACFLTARGHNKR